MLGVGDFDGLLSAFVVQFIRALGMIGEDFDFGGLERQCVEHTLVADDKLSAVEIGLHQFGFAQEASLDDAGLFEFAFGGHDIVASVEGIFEFDRRRERE